MLNFVKVDFEQHVDKLFQLLNERKFTISHDKKTLFEEHSNFVKFHPYREWCLVEADSLLIGTFYITFENIISINIVTDRKQWFPDVLKKILVNYKPLKEIKSLRNKDFLINCPIDDFELKEILKSSAFEEIQSTFKLVR